MRQAAAGVPDGVPHAAVLGAEPHSRARSLAARATRLAARALFAAWGHLSTWLVLPLLPGERVLTPHPSCNSLTGLEEEDCTPSVGVSFGGCGMLYPYQLGAAEYLAQEFETSSLQCAGHSAGFAAALCLAASVPCSLHWQVLCRARVRWRTRWLGFVGDSEEQWMAPYLCALAPFEAAILTAAAEGRLTLGHTRVRLLRPGRWPPLRAGHAVTCAFSSLRAFVHAVTVSQRCPPFYRAPGWLHGAWGIDGAFSALFTVPPGCSSARLLSVSPTNPLADIAPQTPLPPSWFCTVPSAERWETLRAMGFRDAQAARGVCLQRGLTPCRKGHAAAPAETGARIE